MILSTPEIKVEKSSDFQSTDFRIDGKYKNKVLWMLINQYRHKVRTPVQEIISNARDAQRENGNPDTPIKIQLPTKIEPTFIVRDFGVGMDENRIKTIFTSFGASTKNADNSQTGGFGIGAKSPLAYTDSFNIKTYVDGQYWFYVIAKTEDEGIGINLLGTGKTDEPNGTEVQIPVDSYDTNDFKEAACRCTLFWDIQPVFNLLDEDLFSFKNESKINDNLSILSNDAMDVLFNSNILVVVDGIPYEIDSQTIRTIEAFKSIKNTISYSTKAVFFLNTGDIDLLQTRESIDETNKTTLKLTEIAVKGLQNIKEYIESFLTDKTLKGRLKQYSELHDKFNRIPFHKFGTFNIGNNRVSLDKNISTLEYSYRSKAYSRRTVSTPQRHVDSIIAYTEKDLDHFYYDDLKESESDAMKARRMRYHVTDKNEKVILVSQGNASNFTYVRTLRLLKVKKLSSLCKPPKAVKVKGAKRIVAKLPDVITVHEFSYNSKYYYYDVKRLTRDISIKKNTTKYVYVEYSKSSKYTEQNTWVKLLKDQYDVTVCKMSKDAIKAVKNNKNFTHIDEFMADFKPTKEMLNKVIEADYQSKYKSEAKLIVTNKKKIADKILIKLAQCAIVEKEQSEIRLPSELKVEIQMQNKKLIQNKTRLLQKLDERIGSIYPMLDSRQKRQDNINYINSRRN